jgi:hypothetical protein
MSYRTSFFSGPIRTTSMVSISMMTIIITL